jgi:hypothetical protein
MPFADRLRVLVAVQVPGAIALLCFILFLTTPISGAHVATGLVPRRLVLTKAAAEMTSTLLVGGGRIDVTIESGDLKLTQTELMRWVQMAAEAVATYYGKYPVPHLTLRIHPFDGRGVRHGQTWGMGGGLIKIGVGSESLAADLANDWMLTHEMVHLSFPSMEDDHHWIEEGIATYVEPIARIQAKQMGAPSMWADLARDMPKGVPRSDDKGLDHTHTWASTYWGGALFCFLADVQIRERTHNQKGLQDALRAILNAGGDIREDWKLEDVLKAGDRATGVAVLSELYSKMKDQPMPIDLASLWRELGIEPDGKAVRLIDDAPQAAIRRSITAPHTTTSGQPSASLPSSAVFAGRSAASSSKLVRR